MTKLVSEKTTLLWHIIGVTKLYTDHILLSVFKDINCIYYIVYGIMLDIYGLI